MSKEYLEAFDILLQHIETEADWSDYEKVKNAHKIVEQSLKRLEAIDNANPSEALRELDEIIEYITEDKKVKYKATILFDCEIIKQALLKAQEPKHYLKWEDLEFKTQEQTLKVLLNGNKYTLKYHRAVFDDYIDFLTDDELDRIFLYEGVYPQDKQFFNNLHLERVEE